MSTQLPPLFLNKNAERRLKAGHIWVYSNEIDTRRTPLNGFEPGDQAQLLAANGKPLGTVFVNPHTLISARLVSRDPRQPFSPKLLEQRLGSALALRERLFDRPFYRLAFGDSDGLPGLVIDRFGGVCVVQVTTAGMERMKESIVRALQRTVQPTTVVFKNDARMRQVEGLPEQVECALGEMPQTLEVEENGVHFEVPLRGQKTGWFYDHRMNRQRLAGYAAGQRVLDVFSYMGGWGVQAGVAGAESVTFVDSSATALEWAGRNAERNGCRNIASHQGDAFEVLKTLCDARERFDVLVLDPPALIPRRRDQKAGEQAYQRLNQLALRLLSPGGLLVSASCSMHLGRDRLLDIIRASGRTVDRFLQVIEQGHQGPDHPLIPAVRETDYLKAFFVRSLFPGE